MPTHAEKRVVAYSPDQMFDLVADVARYPEFLPWCVAAKLREQSETELVADLTIGFKLFRETFTSRVKLDRPDMVHVAYENGPFRYLNNHWKFLRHERGCLVDFYVDFEFRSKLLQLAIGVVFNEATRLMVNAFLRRARVVYGPPKPLAAGGAPEKLSRADPGIQLFALVQPAGAKYTRRMTWTIHGDRGSGSMIPEMLLALAGAPVALVEYPLETNSHLDAEYLALNPMGQLPAVITPDGQLITESAACLLFIAESFPAAHLQPPPGHPDRTKFLRWVIMLVANIYPCVTRWDYPERFTTDPAGAPAVKQSARDEADRLWAMLNQHLAPDPWCVTEFSALDVQVAVMSRWMGGPERRAEKFPALAAHAARVLQRPPLSEIYARHYA